MNLINDYHPTSGIALETWKPVFQAFPREAMWERDMFINQDLLLSFTVFSILQNLKLFDKIPKVISTRDTIRFWKNISSRRRMSGVLPATQHEGTMSLCLNRPAALIAHLIYCKHIRQSYRKSTNPTSKTSLPEHFIDRTNFKTHSNNNDIQTAAAATDSGSLQKNRLCLITAGQCSGQLCTTGKKSILKAERC